MDLDSDTEVATVYHEVEPCPTTKMTNFEETEDGITASEYTIKQEFSQEIYESHEKNIWLFELTQTI